MNIHSYLLSIDLEYRNMNNQIVEFEKRDYLNENEKRDLKLLKEAIDKKKEEIELGR